MNLKQLAATGLMLMVSALIACSAVRAEDATADQLQQMRLASRWPTTQPQQTPLPAVVRVIATDRNSLSLGSGTLVDANDQYGLVVTNWHVVRDAVGPVEVVFPDGFHSMAGIVRTDREWDLAALLIWKPPVQPVPLSTAPPQPGEMLTIAGYGSGDYKMQSGLCTQYLSPAPGKPMEIVELAAAARHGDSGGPILNNRGELVGVLFGEGGGRTDGSYGGRVNQFLQLCAGDLRNMPASNIAQNSATRYPTAIAQTNVCSADRNPSAQFAGSVGEAPQAPTQWSQSGWNNSALPQIADRRTNGNPLPGNQSTRELTIAAEQPTRSAVSESGTTSKGPTFVWFDELKSFLAAIGVAAIVLQLLRSTGSKE